MDPNNPVVALCAEGMRAEAERRWEDARRLFEQAWAVRQDDYDACVAAHYVARHQPLPADTLAWNQKALDHAAAVGDERVTAFYASLYLNLGHSYEVLDDADAARHHYVLAERSLDQVPDGPYGAMVRGAVEAAHARLGGSDRR